MYFSLLLMKNPTPGSGKNLFVDLIFHFKIGKRNISNTSKFVAYVALALTFEFKT